jgi:hypothetical protein
MQAEHSSYAPVYAHDSIEEIIPDIFMVRGCIQMNPLMRISRNMAIIRHDGELTLVNPIRLDESGEAQLSTLGEIARILRLGPMHGIDDPYYIDRFSAELWAQDESRSYPEPKPDRRISAASTLPFPDASLFCFEGLTQHESALLIDWEGGILLTCDAIQHYGDYRHNSWIARMVMPFIGFPKTTIVGPMWLEAMTPKGASLESEFRRLLELDFRHLLSAHGSYLPDLAHTSVEAAVERAFSN